jgi:hypothetical protein
MIEWTLALRDVYLVFFPLDSFKWGAVGNPSTGSPMFDWNVFHF